MEAGLVTSRKEKSCLFSGKKKKKDTTNIWSYAFVYMPHSCLNNRLAFPRVDLGKPILYVQIWSLRSDCAKFVGQRSQFNFLQECAWAQYSDMQLFNQFILFIPWSDQNKGQIHLIMRTAAAVSCSILKNRWESYRIHEMRHAEIHRGVLLEEDYGVATGAAMLQILWPGKDLFD